MSENEEDFLSYVENTVHKKHRVSFNRTDPLMVIPTMVEASGKYLESMIAKIMQTFSEHVESIGFRIENEISERSESLDKDNQKRTDYLANRVFEAQETRFKEQLAEFQKTLAYESQNAVRKVNAELRSIVKDARKISILNIIASGVLCLGIIIFCVAFLRGL
ncbi:MAG: hypothetical protein LBK03_01000 [Bacteroidales bacterium]|jgi:mevalonate kinase|nr:hypothetical protein [Bacteroidales bacterium]